MNSVEKSISKVTSCPKCFIRAGRPCLDMRKPNGKTRYIKHIHKERRKAYQLPGLIYYAP